MTRRPPIPQRTATLFPDTTRFRLGAADDASLARRFARQPGTLDRQALAAWTVLRQRLTLVTGGPGTGKTTTVARMLALLAARPRARSEEHTSELQSLMRISYAVFCLNKKNNYTNTKSPNKLSSIQPSHNK